ncbi:phosphoribulokinase [Cardiobacterium sp. AH-315-I02]|nr:phosphoribulokinase [Cardiobacterium sp. AH-315-I02]
MSQKHPVVVVTGSSGAGTSTVKHAFEQIFLYEKINPVIIEGDSFHRYDRVAMKQAMTDAEAKGDQHFSHFGADANLFGKLEELFDSYGKTGGGQKRLYLHSDEEAAAFDGLSPGQFTPWEDIPAGSDILFYEGLHGGVVTDEADVAKHVDLLVGVVPSVNLEWIQKIHRDNAERGYSEEVIVDTILRRMNDYVKYITPQFSLTDINFQRIATVDTSNPFIARDIPTPDESFIVIRFKQPEKFNINFPDLLDMIQNSFMSRRNTIVVPGSKMGLAMELILTPIIHGMIENSK